MERSTITKKVVLMAVSLAAGGVIITSLLGTLNLAQSPLPVKASSSSQDAQIAAKEHEFLAVLKKEPKNLPAITGMEQVVEYYGLTGNKPKTIESLEKLLAAAPQAVRAKEYAKVLETIKNPAAAGKKEK
jgi:hypothetical protein